MIVAGVDVPPGKTLWEQSRWIARDQSLRHFVLNEPRGGVFRHVNLLVPAVNPEASLGFTIMEPADTPPMSGSNAMCVATVALETGVLTMKEPETKLVLEAPGGLESVTATCNQSKVQRVRLQNTPSFVSQLGASIQVPDLGRLNVDVAYGGDSFVLVDAASLGFELVPHEAQQLAQLGVAITQVGGGEAIIPIIEGLAFTTGRKQLWLTPGDPWPAGYRVTDTWPLEK
ncbi:MAG: proline racemase family protein [Lysobacterales bacterium]